MPAVDLDLALFLIAAAAMVFVGLPAIRATVFLPAELRLEEAPPEELTAKQREFFAGADAALGRLGYHPVRAFRVANLPGANISRFYAGAADPAWIMISALADRKGVSATVFAEIMTRFRDGTLLTTKNTQFTDVFAPLPRQIVQVFPGVEDLAELKARHDARLPGLMEREPEWRDPRTLFSVYRDHHKAFCEHQVSRALLRHDREAGVYRATLWTGLRGLVNFLNPLADNFTPRRLAAGALLGAGPPLLAALYWKPAASALGLPAAWGPEASRWIVMAAAFAAAGVAVGCVFRQKSHVWAFVLGYLPLRCLGEGAAASLPLGLLTAVLAHLVSAWRNQRERLV